MSFQKGDKVRIKGELRESRFTVSDIKPDAIFFRTGRIEFCFSLREADDIFEVVPEQTKKPAPISSKDDFIACGMEEDPYCEGGFFHRELRIRAEPQLLRYRFFSEGGNCLGDIFRVTTRPWANECLYSVYAEDRSIELEAATAREVIEHFRRKIAKDAKNV